MLLAGGFASLKRPVAAIEWQDVQLVKAAIRWRQWRPLSARAERQPNRLANQDVAGNRDLRRPFAFLLQLGEGLRESRKGDRNADARFLGLEDDEDGRLACLELLDELVLGDNLCITGEGMAAQKRRMPHVLVIDLQAESRWQQYPHGREHPKHAGAVGELLEIDRKADVVAILGGHALHERARLGFRAGWRSFAHHLPVAVLRLDGAIHRLLCEGAIGGENRHCSDERQQQG